MGLANAEEHAKIALGPAGLRGVRSFDRTPKRKVAPLSTFSEYTANEIAAVGLDSERLPRHIAVIMDGNGRWARARGLPRIEGHRRGVKSVEMLPAREGKTAFREMGGNGPMTYVIDEIIFAVDSRRLAELEEVFLLCDEEGIRTRVAVDFFPHINSQVYLDRLGASPDAR